MTDFVISELGLGYVSATGVEPLFAPHPVAAAAHGPVREDLLRALEDRCSGRYRDRLPVPLDFFSARHAAVTSDQIAHCHLADVVPCRPTADVAEVPGAEANNERVN